jgi:hypothetical protein
VKSSIVTLLVAALVLSACAEEPVTVAHHRKHVSPPPVEPPVLADPAFDQAEAGSRLAEGQAALQRGDLAQARRATDSALALWPVAIEGWRQLIEICKRQGDGECERYGVFFQAKLEMLEGLPMRTASLGFAAVADNKVGTRVDNGVYDQRMLDMASRLWVFCSKEDPAHSRAPEPTESSFNETYPYAPALLVIGIGAGLISGAKALANK